MYKLTKQNNNLTNCSKYLDGPFSLQPTAYIAVIFNVSFIS